RAESALEEVPRLAMRVVEVPAIAAMCDLNALAQVRLRRFGEVVDMVVHQAVGQATPFKLLGDRSPDRQVPEAIVVVEEDRLAAIAAGEYVIDPARNQLTRSPRHGGERPPHTTSRPHRGQTPRGQTPRTPRGMVERGRHTPHLAPTGVSPPGVRPPGVRPPRPLITG